MKTETSGTVPGVSFTFGTAKAPDSFSVASALPKLEGSTAVVSFEQAKPFLVGKQVMRPNSHRGSK